LANCYAELDSFDLALDFYEKQELICLAIGNEYGLGYLYENRGQVFKLLGQYDDAIASLKKSIVIRDKFDQKDVLAATWIKIADAQLQKGLTKEAQESLEYGVSIASAIGVQARLKEAYDIYANLYARQGNFKLAYNYNLKAEAIKDSLLNEKIVEQSLKIDALTDYENLQREQQISLLSAQSELKDLKISQANRNLWLSLLGLLGISIFSYLIYNSRQKTRQLYDELTEKQSLLQKTLADKDYLLREIHHRVKNNLQVISSLLKLQSASVTDERAQQALDEGRNRVRSMALIHQNLYQDGKQLGGLNVREYFEQLTAELFESYNVDESKVSLSLAIQDLILDVDTVVPMGLMINELVSNSLKYAFADGRSGRISVSLKETDDATIVLAVADDGPGYDESKINAKSFGHKLVRAFAERLNADYTLDTTGGVHSTFKIKDYRKAA
jgi:two-component sensor histidine kinase